MSVQTSFPGGQAQFLECEFIIQEAVAKGGLYPVLALTPAGPAAGRLHLDTEDPELKRLLDLIREQGPDRRSREAFGRLLFAAVLSDKPVRDAWQNTLGRFQGIENAKLRLRFWIEPSELAELPWELVYDAQQGFLGARLDMFLSRYLPGPEPRFMLPAPKMRILAIVAEGAGLTPIDQKVLTDLRGVLNDPVAPTDWKEMSNPEVANVLGELQLGYHILHFIGHGTAEDLLGSAKRQAPTSGSRATGSTGGWTTTVAIGGSLCQDLEVVRAEITELRTLAQQVHQSVK